jgi:hypothetical protein
MVMKNLKYIIIWTLALVMATSCEDYLGDNRDPDAVDMVPPDQILPVVLFYSALQNYDHSEYGTYLSQCLTTAGKSQTGSHAYRSGWEFLGMNRHPQWRRHFFDVGANARDLILFSSEENSINYVAVARLINLLSAQQTTDVFGDMPLSDAYKSSSPKYDTQEAVYSWMLQEADDLIALFNSAEVTQSTNRIMDKDVDRIFAGDMNKWKQMVYAVKSRILLRDLPNVNTGTAQQIVTAAETALNGWIDPNYKFDGGSSVEKNNMWGRTNRPVGGWQSRSNDLSGAIPSKFFMEDMLGFNPATGESADPRLPYLMKAGGDAGAGIDSTFRYLENNIGMPASSKIEWYPDLYVSTLTTDTSTICLFTKGELHFIISEAAYWAGDKSKAVDHLIAGIRYHMTRLGVPAVKAEAYISNPDLVPGSANITLSHIMQEKYKAMYLQPEQWNDLRRYAYSNSQNNIAYDNSIIYPTLRRPHNLYEAYWSNENEWIQRINYDPETEEKYNREELIRLGAFRDPEWLKKPMIWGRAN